MTAVSQEDDLTKERIQSLRQQRTICSNNLNMLQEREAKYGTLNVPTELFNEIRDTKSKIVEIDTELAEIMLGRVEEIKKEIYAKEEDLRKVVRAVVEISYILGSSSFLAMGGDQLARERLEQNLDVLTHFVESDEGTQSKWWDSLHGLFPGRNKIENEEGN